LIRAENSVDFGSIQKVANLLIPCSRISFSRIFKALLSSLKILKNYNTNSLAPSLPAFYSRYYSIKKYIQLSDCNEFDFLK
jgi:3-polyprenyl-4-hydroxybenzoate decarboxylase